jgi:hypothetical protein
VAVRGRDQRVCLAFLSIIGAQKNEACSEFEGMAAVPRENPPPANSPAKDSPAMDSPPP